MDQETILIVDPHAASLKLAAAVLRREGYKVYVCSNGEQADLMLETSQVQLVLVSASLPGMSSTEFLAALKENPRNSRAMAIAMVEALDAPGSQLAIDEGFAGCLVKPLDPIELVRLVRSLLERRKATALPAVPDDFTPYTSEPQWTEPEPLPVLHPAEAAAPRLPERIAGRLSDVQVAMVGFSNRTAEQLCETLARVGARGRIFEQCDSVESAEVRTCSLFLIHVRPETRWTPLLSPAQAIANKRPVVLVGHLRDLLTLDPVVLENASEFLIDNWQAEEVVLRLALVLARHGAAEGKAAQAGAAKAAPGSGEVLIVDDDPNVRILVQSVLENNGIRCRVASNAAEGIAIARAYRPSAALLDVNMPGMSGFEALPKIRAEVPGVRVVMLTGRQQEGDVMQGFDLGTDDYVVKPFIPRELVARVKRLL